MKNFLLIGAVFLIIGGIYINLQTKTDNNTMTKQAASPTLIPTTATVPPPEESDIVRTFLNLISEKRPNEAVAMMTVTDDPEKQAWAVQFNAIKSLKIISIEPSLPNSFKVVVDVKMDPASANTPIPFYGWDDGQNTRFINLEKVGNDWKISEIATGP